MQIDDKALSNIQKTLDRFQKNFKAIDDELSEIKDLAKKTLDVAAEIRYHDGIEKIEGAFKSLLEGAHDIKSTIL